jgi:hypothetical protein
VILPFGDAHARAYQEKIDFFKFKFKIVKIEKNIILHYTRFITHFVALVYFIAVLAALVVL